MIETALDPLAPDVIADPYPFLARQRDNQPVAYCPAIDMWLITRHADIDYVFTHPDLFSAANAQAPLTPLCTEAMEILKAGFRIQPVMSNADKPVHPRIRRRLAQAFSARRMRLLTPIIEERCQTLIDAFADRGKADLMQELCYPLPALTIFAMIGFPPQDSDRIKAWCADKLVVNWGRPSQRQQIDAARTMVAFWAYCEDFVALRRTQPADDLTSDLMSGQDDSEPLTDREIASIIFGLSFAGHETTTNHAANAIRRIHENGLWQAIRADRSLIPAAVEETLRFDSSVTAWRRVARQDCQIGGVAIPAGAKLMLSLAAANRDPAKFPDPDRFDIARNRPEDHLSFGKGVHYCLGVPLARIESGILLNQLLDRFPDLTLVQGGGYEFPANISFRGPLSLPARWTPPGG